MYVNSWEMTAEQMGWKVYRVVQTKEEAVDIVDQLRRLKIQCRRCRHVSKTIGADLQFIWVNTATLDKPYKPKTREVDKTNKRNIKCFNCKHWDGEGWKGIGTCVLTGEEMQAHKMRTKCFEWKK